MDAKPVQRSLRSARRSLGRRFAENRAIVRAAIAATLLTTAAGCSTIEAGGIGGGVRPDQSVLDAALTFGVSTRADVTAALGEPNGPAGVFLPIDDKPREAWAYNYELSGVETGGGRLALSSIRTYLFIYFDEDLYDGYMWFSTVPSGSAGQ